MMLQLLDNIVRKGIVCIDMAREQERSIARLFQMFLGPTETSRLCAAASLCHGDSQCGALACLSNAEISTVILVMLPFCIG